MSQKITVLFIFEILGRPPEYIKESLEKIIENLGKMQGTRVLKKNVYDTKPVEDEKVKDMFTSFAEVEIEVENFSSILFILFSLLPSHVEIITPEKMIFRNTDLTSLLTDISLKLHHYDNIVKAVTIERNMLMQKLKEMNGELNVSVKMPEPEKKKENKKKAKKK